MKEYLIAIILGIVEGITEFLPISSTGHLIIVNEFAGFPDKFGKFFDVVIQSGAILSVIVYFWNRLFPFGHTKTVSEKKEILGLWKKTIVGVVPALILGWKLGNFIKEKLFNPPTVAISLIIGGIVLIIIENKRYKNMIQSTNDLRYETVVCIGLIQCLSMIPGTSRSAATIIGAMLLGASRLVAAEFSFFLAIPTIFAASCYSLLKQGFSLTFLEIKILFTGFIVSFFVALLVIKLFMRYISNNDFKMFGYYRITLGLLILIYLGFIK